MKEYPAQQKILPSFKLPRDIWYCILSYLLHEDVYHFSYVSHASYHIGTDEKVWKPRVKAISDCEPLSYLQPLKTRAKGKRIASEKLAIEGVLTYHRLFGCIQWLKSIPFQKMRTMARNHLAYSHVVIKTLELRERYWEQKAGDSLFSTLLRGLAIFCSDAELTTYAFKQGDVRNVLLTEDYDGGRLTSFAEFNSNFAQMISDDPELLEHACYGGYLQSLQSVSKRTGVAFNLPKYGWSIVNGTVVPYSHDTKENEYLDGNTASKINPS